MSLTRGTGPRSDEGGSAPTSGVAAGKVTRSGALPAQRKASAESAAVPNLAASPSFGAGDDPFGLHLPASGGNPLPAPVQAKMESSFGADFSDVRVHEGPEASQMGALAFAQGTDVHFAPGQFNPGTPSGDELIGHELAHVEQQRAGRVSTPQGKGAPVVADQALEAEADRAGERAARGESVGGAMSSATSGAVQRKEGAEAAHEAGHDTFGLGGYLAKLKESTGISGDMGKYAEAKLGITTPPIPQLGGGALKIEGDGRYMTSKEGNELEVGLHVGVKWGIDLKIFKADVEVFGEGKIKLKAKDGEMQECLNAAIKGVLYDALRAMNVRNVASLAGPLTARAAEWCLGSEIFDYDIFKALGAIAGNPNIPDWVKGPAKDTLASLTAFFGKHSGSFEVSMAIGVGGEVGGGADGKGLSGGATAKAVHGIAGEDGENVSDVERRNEFAVEAHLKKGETEGKVGYVFGGGRNIISVEAAFQAENNFDFDKAKIVSVGGIMKLVAALGLGTSIGKAVTAPSGSELANAIVSGLASGAGVIGNKHLEILKKSYKLSLEIEREGDQPWKDAKVDCKLFLGNAVGGDAEAGSLGKVEASAGAGTFISITREVKEHLAGGQ